MRAARSACGAFGLAVMIAAMVPSTAARADASCDGPTECCPEHLQHPAHAQRVQVGIVVMGISAIDERAGTWDADYYLYESWAPLPGFSPQTEVVNEVERASVQFDDVSLRDGQCLRSRRLHSTLRSELNLHAFPFDRQTLSIQVSDDEHTAAELVYTSRPFTLGLDDHVHTALLGWEIDNHPNYRRTSQAFRWEPGAPAYDYVDVDFHVQRHVIFHLTKFFLPLFVILSLAFAAFWIHPEDLGSQLTIGVTCVLAAIAFQFAEAGNLPEVSYLTLADRVYVICYIAIALAVLESIYTNTLARHDQKDKARKVDRICRIAFPAGVVVAIVVSVLRAFAQS